MLAGTTDSFGQGGADAWVFKIDGNGNVLWDHLFGTGGNDDSERVAATPDGGYVVVGTTAPQGPTYAWAIKLDSAGQVQWQKQYAASGIFMFSSAIAPTSDDRRARSRRSRSTSVRFA